MKSLTAYVLTEDIKLASAMSDILRETGCLTEYFDSPKNFWFACLGEKPQIAIVDIKLLVTPEIDLSKHPLVITGSLPLVLLYQNESKPLLKTALKINHLGLIQKVDTTILEEYEFLASQIIALLDRTNAFLRSEYRLNHLESDYKNIESHLIQSELELKKMQQAQKEVSDFFNDIKNGFSTVVDHQSFLSHLQLILDKTDVIDHYLLLEKMSSGLYKAALGGRKAITHLPVKMSEKEIENGREKSHLTLQLSLLVKGKMGSDAKIIFFEEDLVLGLHFREMPSFPFEYWGMILRSMYFGMHANKTKHEAVVGNLFDLLQNLQTASRAGDIILSVHLDNIAKASLTKQFGNFYFSTFYNQFTAFLSNEMGIQLKVYIMDFKTLLISMDRDRFATQSSIFNHLIEKFPYGKFFEFQNNYFYRDFIPNWKVASDLIEMWQLETIRPMQLES